MLEVPWMIEVEDDGTRVVVRPRGEVDLVTSAELAAVFDDCGDHHEALICDVSGITFINSAGLQMLLQTLDREPQRFALAGSSAPVERLLGLTATADRFPRADAA
jgi:anti-anti-sigma factor